MGKTSKRYLIDGKKISRKAAAEKLGEERLKRFERDAEEQFREDPFVQNDFFCGRFMFTIEFPIIDK